MNQKFLLSASQGKNQNFLFKLEALKSQSSMVWHRFSTFYNVCARTFDKKNLWKKNFIKTLQSKGLKTSVKNVWRKNQSSFQAKPYNFRSHCKSLIEVFLNEIVRFSNCFWKLLLITFQSSSFQIFHRFNPFFIFSQPFKTQTQIQNSNKSVNFL